MIGEAVRMASPQKSVAVRYEGSSFTIKNILNLPEDAQDSNGKVSHVPCSSVASSPIRQMYGPPSNTSPHTFKPSGPWPYDQVFFGTQIPSWSMAARFTRHALLLGKYIALFITFVLDTPVTVPVSSSSHAFLFTSLYLSLAAVFYVCAAHAVISKVRTM